MDDHALNAEEEFDKLKDVLEEEESSQEEKAAEEAEAAPSEPAAKKKSATPKVRMYWVNFDCPLHGQMKINLMT